MSHLKKLSEKLATKWAPTLHHIITVGSSENQLLETPTMRPISLTQKMTDFYIPSLRMTAAANGLASLSAVQIGHEMSIFVMYNLLINDR